MGKRAFPRVALVLPHSGEMVLLSRILEHDTEKTVCEVRVDDSVLFADESGRVPVWVTIEYMAQCIAVHGSLEWHDGEDRPQLGLFLGSRRLKLDGSGFAPGAVLHVTARHLRGGLGMASFECSVCEPGASEPIAHGKLNVFVADDFEAFRPEGSGDG